MVLYFSHQDHLIFTSPSRRHQSSHLSCANADSEHCLAQQSPERLTTWNIPDRYLHPRSLDSITLSISLFVTTHTIVTTRNIPCDALIRSHHKAATITQVIGESCALEFLPILPPYPVLGRVTSQATTPTVTHDTTRMTLMQFRTSDSTFFYSRSQEVPRYTIQGQWPPKNPLLRV